MLAEVDDPELQTRIFNMFIDSDSDLIERYVERKDTEIPATFVPSANGFVIPTDALEALLYRLRRGECTVHVKGKEYSALSEDGFLWVRKYGDLWSIERLEFSQPLGLRDEVLAFTVRPDTVLPILTHKRDAAMRFCKAADPEPGQGAEAAGISWVPLGSRHVY
jgi:hypothetical protein